MQQRKISPGAGAAAWRRETALQQRKISPGTEAAVVGRRDCIATQKDITRDSSGCL